MTRVKRAGPLPRSLKKAAECSPTFRLRDDARRNESVAPHSISARLQLHFSRLFYQTNDHASPLPRWCVATACRAASAGMLN